MNTLRINSLLLALLIGLNVFTPAQAGQANDPVAGIFGMSIGGGILATVIRQIYHSENETAVWIKNTVQNTTSSAMPLLLPVVIGVGQKLPTLASHLYHNPHILAQMGAVGFGIGVVSTIGNTLCNPKTEQAQPAKSNNSKNWIYQGTQAIANQYSEAKNYISNNKAYTTATLLGVGALLNENCRFHKYQGLLAKAYMASIAIGEFANWCTSEKTDSK